MNWENDLLKECDSLFDWLYKADNYYDRLSKQLANILLLQISEKKKDAATQLLRYIKAGSGIVSLEEVTEAVKNIEKLLSKDLELALKEDVAKYQLKCYKRGQTDLGLNFEFNQTDLRAIGWLEKDQMYWIGQYYDSNLRDKLMESVKDIHSQLLTRDETANAMAAAFKDRIDRTKGYWAGLADHIVTRSREFGRTEGYVKAKINHFKIDAVLDNRTSKICRYMHGRIIQVKDAVNQRNSLMDAKTPEDVKRLAPWLSDKEAVKKIQGAKTDTIVGKYNLILPPFHFHCRTRTVVVYDGEAEEIIIDSKKSLKDFFNRNNLT